MIDSKNIWFDYLLNHKESWTHGMTEKRLLKVKEKVFNDEPTMYDLLIRHGGKDMTPDQLKEYDIHLFNHGYGNLVCNIHYIMMDEKIIKS